MKVSLSREEIPQTKKKIEIEREKGDGLVLFFPSCLFVGGGVCITNFIYRVKGVTRSRKVGDSEISIEGGLQ